MYNGMLAIKQTEILLLTAMQMGLENIILSEISQRKTNILSFICGIQKIKMNIYSKTETDKTEGTK